MSIETMQTAALVLLAVIALVAVLSLVLLLRAAALMRAAQDATLRLLATRDPDPALHSLVQHAREANRLLTTIDKRLEKLEALEKVQIANLSVRDELARLQR